MKQNGLSILVSCVFVALCACKQKSNESDRGGSSDSVEVGDPSAAADSAPGDIGDSYIDPGDASSGGDGDSEGDSGPTLAVWEYDFMVIGNGDATLSSDWYNDAGYEGETTLGYYMSQASVAPPFLFTGDFTVEIEFYLKVLTDENIFRHAFRLVDPNWENNSSRRFVSFSALYAATPEHEDAYYQIDQGNGSYTSSETQGNPPGFVANAVSTCTLTKLGSTVTIRLNGELLREVVVTSANTPSIGYAPLVHGHNSSDQADSNFYLRKIKVTYMSNERVEHDWNE